MPVTRRLIGIDEALWQRVQDRAAADGRTLITTVGRLLRAGLAAVGEPVLTTADDQLRAPAAVLGRPVITVGQLREMVAHVPSVTPSEPGDDLRGHDHGRPLSPREIERRRIARQEWARTHPEDLPQD